MRVLHLLYDHRTNPWVGGGGAVRAHELNRRLVARGVQVRALAGAHPGAPMERVEDGVLYRFVGAPRPYPLSRWSYARAARRALVTESYDVAVVDFSVYTPIALPGRADRMPIAAVVHHLTGPTARERWGRVLGSWIARAESRRLRRFHALSAVSRHTLAEIRERTGPGTEIRLIGNGVADELFDIEPHAADPPYLLYLGRIDLFHKGLDVLIEAFEGFSARHPGTRLRIAGAGKDREALRGLVARSAAAGRVDLLGNVSPAEKRSLLAGARALVVASRLEGFGMVAAEAMAAGVPLVATTAGSLPEVTGGDENALLVPPGDAVALGAALARLETDAGLRGRLAARARAEAARRFRWDVVADQHHQFLREVAASA